MGQIGHFSGGFWDEPFPQPRLGEAGFRFLVDSPLDRSAAGAPYLSAAVPDVSAGNPSDILWVVSTARRSALAVVAALFAGLVVGVLALPSSGVDTYPPVCWAWGGYEVPCDSGPSYFFVFAAAGITAIGTWYLTRPRSHA